MRLLYTKTSSLGDSERETLVCHNTRKLYMAATRAGQRVVIPYVEEILRQPVSLRSRAVAQDDMNVAGLFENKTVYVII